MVVLNISKEVENVLTGQWIIEWYVTIPNVVIQPFFSVAFYSVYLNFIERGLLGFPLALFEAFEVLFTAIVIFTPYLWNEIVR